MIALLRRGRYRGARLAVVAVTAGAAVLVAGAAAADPPPWQQSGTVNNDPNAVGTLSFFDASGTQIFSGSVSAAPFAAYVEGSAALRTGDTEAALFAYLPTPDAPAGAWTGSLLTSTTDYPNATAPGALSTATLPLYSGAAGDVSLADFITGHPNTSATTGYAGVYELRLRTVTAGTSATPTYDVADVLVSGDTWQVVYPEHFTSTTTSLEITPSSGLHAGASVTLKATVSDSSATGSVHFTDGATALGADVALSGGIASKVVKISTAGSHTFHATYVPGSGSTFAGSSGQVTASFAKASTTVTATWPAVHYGSAWTVKASVAATGLTPTGTVTLKNGSTVLKSATLASGKASLTVSGKALGVGKHALTLAYAGSANAASSSAAKTLTVAKAVAHVTNKLVAATVHHTAHAKLTVKVTATGLTPAGTINVYDGTKHIATGTLSNGTVTITLPLLARGKHTIHATYLGSSTVASGTAASVTLTVIT